MKKKHTSIIDTIKEVFDREITELIRIKNSIDQSFEKAVNLINQAKGKVVFSGIGKSGYIARKIAATFSSIGVKSVFIHPSEALHGDIGLIDEEDCFFMISKSGESEELIKFSYYINNLNLPQIIITANPNSTLAKTCRVTLHLNIEQEACPLNLVPTTSTTASLLIGDAIAIALMKVNDFRKEKFALYHPGGSIGKRLLFKVKDIMWAGENNPIVHEDDDLKAVIIEVTSKHFGGASVVDRNGYFKGLITDHDIRTNINEDLFHKKAKDIMNPDPVFIYEDTIATNAIMIMESGKRQFNILPVLDRKDKAVGMVRLHDLVRQGILDFTDKSH
jgi:arabinose-5-phosphate isomerase